MGSKGLWEKIGQFFIEKWPFFGHFWQNFHLNFCPLRNKLSQILAVFGRKTAFFKIFSKNFLECSWPNTPLKFGIPTTKTRKVISSAGLWSKNSNDLTFGSPWLFEFRIPENVQLAQNRLMLYQKLQV